MYSFQKGQREEENRCRMNYISVTTQQTIFIIPFFLLPFLFLCFIKANFTRSLALSLYLSWAVRVCVQWNCVWQNWRLYTRLLTAVSAWRFYMEEAEEREEGREYKKVGKLKREEGACVREK